MCPTRALLFLLALVARAHGVALPMSAMPVKTQAGFKGLSPAAMAMAMSELSQMGDFDAEHTEVHSTGRFFFVEDAVQDSEGLRRRQARMVSGTRPSGYSPQGACACARVRRCHRVPCFFFV